MKRPTIFATLVNPEYSIIDTDGTHYGRVRQTDAGEVLWLERRRFTDELPRDEDVRRAIRQLRQ